jgi:hypothetical protein
MAREDGARLFAFLDQHRAERDRRLALGALHGDGAFPNRAVAAMVLVNFPESDSTWWALTEALRDPNGLVRDAAQTTLAQLPARRVDWRPVAPSLRFLLGGTNAPASDDVFRMLARTEVSPTLAATLLRGNGHWILSHLRAEDESIRTGARNLLVQLAGGRDLGDATAWARWIAAL